MSISLFSKMLIRDFLKLKASAIQILSSKCPNPEEMPRNQEDMHMG